MEKKMGIISDVTMGLVAPLLVAGLVVSPLLLLIVIAVARG